jgi:hypothetical protein
MSDITALEAHRIWITAEKIKLVSDRLVGLGPWGVGLDGLLASVPIAGTLYSLGAGVWLLSEGFAAKASAFTLARMGFYLGFRTAVSIVPVEGWFVDILFRGHMHAANALQKDIVRRFGLPSQEWMEDARRRPFAPRARLVGDLAGAR